MTTKRIDILGCPADNLTMSETLLRIDDMITTGKPHQHVVVNVDKLLKLRKDEKLKGIISNCDIVNVDGQPLVWVARLLGHKMKERVAGVDLMAKLVERSAEKGYGIYFLGAKEAVVNEVVAIYGKQFPDLKIAGYRNGYWKPEEEDGVAEDIKKSNADILFVAFSSPKKEIFLNKYLEYMNVAFVMGVGGSFDVVAGFTKRAPNWMQKTGLEWLYRLIQEPKRMWRRYLIGNTKFMFLMMKVLFLRLFGVRNIR